jgi:branched-chain amino acid transport system substrate-binding protein
MLPSPRILLSSLLAVATFVAGAHAQAPIVVGEVASLTGKDAAFGQLSHEGTLLAIEEINAGGGVLGRPISLLTEDDACRPGDAATAARKLIARNQVIALLGEVASSRSLEMAPIAQEEKVPMISPSSTNPKVTAVGNYIFRVCFIDPFQGSVMAKFARQTLKLRRVAVLDSVSSAYSVGLSKFFKADFTAAGGEIALEQKYTEGDKDFRAQLTVIKAAGVDGIFVPGYYQEAALICVQARELGLTLPIFGGDGWEGDPLIEIGGRAVEGVYFSDHFSPENDAPLTRDFVRKFRARFGGETPNGEAACGYDSAMVLADAIRRAGTVAGKPVRDALAATVDFPGVTGVTTIDANRNATKTAVIITVRDGKFRFVETVAP